MLCRDQQRHAKYIYTHTNIKYARYRERGRYNYISRGELYIEVRYFMPKTMEGTVVDYFESSGRPSKCGYCKSPDTSFTQGVWGYQMKCQHFQMLVDRGFQRSGNYVYRPMMKTTCCPQYVVRMDTANFKLSKSQKASIKKFKRYLVEGRKEPADQADPAPEDTSPQQEVHVSVSGASKKERKVVRPGVGPDPNKPPCKKAKLLRQERKAHKQLLAKQQLDGAKLTSVSSSHDNIDAPKLASKEENPPVLCQNLSEYLEFPKHEECVHKFRTRLVPADTFNKDFAATRQESYLVFKKFQTIVHSESEEDAKQQQFKDFLIDTPLIKEKNTDTITYGSFHLQYLLDEKIFAVGVLDILPKGVLCEYLYYDPSYRFIAPGVISALMEISLTQKYYLQDSAMRYYYMGYYVQSCPKMNYKSRYSAAALLCPETHTYVSLDKCIPILECSPYSRLATQEVEDAIETYSDEDLHNVILLTPGGVILTYGLYKEKNGVEVDSAPRGYMKLVGKALATSMKVHMAAIDAATAAAAATESGSTEPAKSEPAKSEPGNT